MAIIGHDVGSMHVQEQPRKEEDACTFYAGDTSDIRKEFIRVTTNVLYIILTGLLLFLGISVSIGFP